MSKPQKEQNASKVQKDFTETKSGQTSCCCQTSSCAEASKDISLSTPAKLGVKARESLGNKKTLNIELLAIDLNTCQRCAPTSANLKTAVRLLTPVAEALGIQLNLQEIVVQTPEQAKKLALLSSPTIRINGQDIAQDIRESECESCAELTQNKIPINCREWHYQGRVYFAAPLPLLLEAIMKAMLNIDKPPVVPLPLAKLPENLQKYFKNKKQSSSKCC